jgi:hypothetical protein
METKQRGVLLMDKSNVHIPNAAAPLSKAYLPLLNLTFWQALLRLELFIRTHISLILLLQENVLTSFFKSVFI